MDTGDERDHLRSCVSAYLGGEERLEWRLTNRKTGVVRERDGTEATVEPAEECGAVAAVTDRRILFLVGGADGGEDDVTSVPHEEVAGVATSEDLLASDLVVTTGAGATWRFTARETDALEEVVADIDDRIAGGAHVEAAIARARDHRDAASAAGDPAAAAREYDGAVAAYREAVDLQTAPAVSAAVDIESLREDVLDTVASAIDCQVELARERRSRGNWNHQAGDGATACEQFSAALAAFDRALELAEECPPGDPDAIADERAALVEKLDELGELDGLDELDVRAAVGADDD